MLLKSDEHLLLLAVYSESHCIVTRMDFFPILKVQAMPAISTCECFGLRPETRTARIMLLNYRPFNSTPSCTTLCILSQERPRSMMIVSRSEMCGCDCGGEVWLHECAACKFR